MTGNWILLRGLTREARHWGDFPERFLRAMPGARITCPDLPGNGSAHRLTSPTAIHGMVEHCRDDLRMRDIAPPYRLLGLSLGAMLAIHWSQIYPDEIASCVLINTSLRPFNPFYRRLKPAAWLPLLRLVLMTEDAQRIERAVLDLTSSQPSSHGALLADWTRYRRQYPVARRNALRQLLAAMRYRALAAKPQAPLLVLAGANDRLVDPACSQAIAAAWQSRYVLHPWAGHDLPLDDGDWIIDHVTQWLHAPQPRKPDQSGRR